MTCLSKVFVALLSLIAYLSITVGALRAATANEINLKINEALSSFYDTVNDGEELVAGSKAALIFPEVYKGGIFFLGGGYGEGALRINNKTVDYYSTATGSFGWQLGLEKRSVIILFLQDNALTDFRNSSNWKVGVDASVTVVTIGADGSIDSSKLNKPIIAFVIDQKGLMYNLTLEGTKVTKLNKSKSD
jgi:lipid-binding SYLF domain-containing protein